MTSAPSPGGAEEFFRPSGARVADGPFPMACAMGYFLSPLRGSGGSLRQRLAQEPEHVLVEDPVHVGRRVLAGEEDVAELLEVGDRVQVARGLLSAVAAVEVAADGT